MGIVEQIKNLVCLYEGWCLLLLKEFKWDQEYLRGEFFNHNDNYLQAIGYKNILDDPTHYRRKLFGECEVCAQSNT